jgi:hypothetical protein
MARRTKKNKALFLDADPLMVFLITFVFVWGVLQIILGLLVWWSSH